MFKFNEFMKTPKGMKPVYYLSGPMRGLPNLNFEAFNLAAHDLRARGYGVINPAEQDVIAGYTGQGPNRPWLECILEDAKAVLTTEKIVLLPGWESSRGALAEIAIKLGDEASPGFAPILEYNGYGKPLTVLTDPVGALLAYRTQAQKVREGFVSDVKTNVLPPDAIEPKNLEVRSFATGATRSAAADKPDYEGFLSPEVIEEFGKYMHAHRHQADGNLRDSDNWQKGIPMKEYIKSLWRHFMHLWLLHRGRVARDEKGQPVTMRETLCAIMFNTMGYFHEWLREGEKEVVIFHRTRGIDDGIFGGLTRNLKKSA